MEGHVYLAFVVATMIMIWLPGPSVLLTVAHSISFGWRRAIATVAGETVGVAVQLLVAAIGLASLLQAVAGAIVPTFLMITFSLTSLWALVAGKASGFLSSQRALRSALRGAGGLMIIAGSFTLLG